MTPTSPQNPSMTEQNTQKPVRFLPHDFSDSWTQNRVWGIFRKNLRRTRLLLIEESVESLEAQFGLVELKVVEKAAHSSDFLQV